MKIGSFWGVTAPMLVLFKEYTTKNRISEFMSMLNSPLNSNILYDLKLELYYLRDSISKAEFKYKSNMVTIYVSKQYKREFTVRDGKGFSTDLDNEYLTRMLKLEMASTLAIKVLNGIDQGNKFLIEDYNGDWNATQLLQYFMSIVNKEIEGKSFSMLEVPKIIRSMYSNLLSDEGINSFYSLLKESFDIEGDLITLIQTDNGSLSLNENTIKIWKYFIDNKDFIDELINTLQVSRVQDKIIFGLPFRDLVKRKPESILFFVKESFDYVKSKHQPNMLINTINDVRAYIDDYKTSVEDYVSISAELTMSDLLSRSELESKLDTFNNGKLEFFNGLFEKKYLRLGDLLTKDFDILCEIYDIIENFTDKGLCSIFDINIKKADWKKVIEELIEIGVCGVNLYSKELFGESIRNTPLVSSDKIVKTKEEIENTYKIIDNVYALLDSIIPIGEVIA